MLAKNINYLHQWLQQKGKNTVLANVIGSDADVVRNMN